jgi:hypothetical protein
MLINIQQGSAQTKHTALAGISIQCFCGACMQTARHRVTVCTHGQQCSAAIGPVEAWQLYSHCWSTYQCSWWLSHIKLSTAVHDSCQQQSWVCWCSNWCTQSLLDGSNYTRSHSVDCFGSTAVELSVQQLYHLLHHHQHNSAYTKMNATTTPISSIYKPTSAEHHCCATGGAHDRQTPVDRLEQCMMADAVRLHAGWMWRNVP